MIDGCGREIDHLRLSLTDRCNLACRYCVPDDQRSPVADSHGIDPGFAFEVVRWLSRKHGVRHLRLTGGEPLLYRHLLPLTKGLADLGTLHEITLTTNGQALAGQAAALRDAGLARINISLDTLDPQRFADLTRGGRLGHTLAGIRGAIDAGLTPVKINVVVQRGLNDREVADIAEWGLSLGCVVRFLEVMPIGPMAHVTEQHLVPAQTVVERLRARFRLEPIPASLGQPAIDYAVTGRGLRGVIGVIAPTTEPFCPRCRRMRVTAQGRIVACLHDARALDLSLHWDGKSLDEVGADAVLAEAVGQKPAFGPRDQTFTMISLGG